MQIASQTFNKHTLPGGSLRSLDLALYYILADCTKSTINTDKNAQVGMALMNRWSAFNGEELVNSM